jgi:hypothetical protein
MPQNPVQSDREKAGYAGPVRKASTETETLSRKLYRESGGGQRELVEDTTTAFGSGRFFAAEQEFDQSGRLIADANSDREADEEPFRSAYNYDANGRLSLKELFNRDGSPAGREEYVYNAGRMKIEELLYAASGVLQSTIRYDEHQNITDIESYGPSGAIVQKQSIDRSYRREGNTLEDSYTPPRPTSGMYLRAVSPRNEEAEPPRVPQQFKVVYTYNDSGQVIKEVVAEGLEKPTTPREG